MLDELAEGLRRDVDAAEKLAARRLPAAAAAFEDRHVRVAERRQACRGLFRQSFPAAIEQDERRGTARNQVCDPRLEVRKRQRNRKKRVPAIVHALLAHIEKRKLAAAGELFAQRLDPRPGRHARASRISVCGGNTRQARSFAS
jgi:uncharacterized ferritin-like protein (DUF455 family)